MDVMDTEHTVAGLGPTRARVLELLQDTGTALNADEVGSRLGIHPNTARFHLDALSVSGLAVRAREDRSFPGRPRVVYSATADSPQVARRRYQLLSEMLTAFIEGQVSNVAVAAERAGRAWSHHRRADPDRQAATEREALEAVVDGLDELGFESRVAEDPESLRVEVTHCPFLEVAETHDDIVCGLHLGLMRGVLERIEAPLGVRSLEPLVQPGLCLAHLSR